ncbi:LuxR family transcriptional regulator [Polaribacter sp. WD7]|uniref:AAA family ATPase n=1 Tax=Polaribacter sp. WD7 TaxID=2269061 RepID=UPI000DF11837|nr:AAA family ATPase [Polaribacter sp. WD7]RCS28089.1 LuxR family transcriptional regulator [Polaribacter sp. WD7]
MLSKKIDLIKKDIYIHQQKLNSKTLETGCLIVKEANTWVDEAKNRPIPNMLFSELWYENEVCILFSDTNLGKSILAVQIADSLSQGKRIHGFKLEGSARKVLYLDFELSDKQFENRYSDNFKNHYQFSPGFFRAELNTDLGLPNQYKNFEEYLCNTLPESISKHKASILIVDNLTFLSGENEKAKDALVLMKTLKKISRTSGVSILVLAHTPKRDESKPITKNDLAGSKMLMNFCDSCFTIGKSSQDMALRYIKQIKQRNTEHIYDSDNIVLCSINKETNFLKFCYEGFDFEKNHLQTNNKISSDQIDNQIKMLVAEGFTNDKIGSRLGYSEAGIRKRRKKLEI